ncbi:acyl-CoA N-acyltransferase [Annulohypoxylon maeteangense]|uniref:acyl-CoA N-acyltransferase n=1 Tax=Annulohypoxylon maeteangense TaxID=1927788 RepID=UPI0020083CB4|nr:acyl-CoA N-acyltransferase [Annulohypoxylon maeteangense]KAI0883511.1 acyl-CoA N-acyltransferase [Annulohypoxylon maeteangense]
MASATTQSEPTPIVKTDKCYIRAYTPGDIPAAAEAANHPEISQYMRNRFPYPYTLEHAKFWVDFSTKADPMVNFAIIAPDGTFAGGIGLSPRDDTEYRTWEVGYWVATNQWGKGIATSALKGFSIWAFKEFPDLLRLEAVVFEGNDGSMKVLERVGYTKEGVRRKAICKKGKVMDLHMFGLLKEEVGRLE